MVSPQVIYGWLNWNLMRRASDPCWEADSSPFQPDAISGRLEPWLLLLLMQRKPAGVASCESALVKRNKVKSFLLDGWKWSKNCVIFEVDSISLMHPFMQPCKCQFWHLCIVCNAILGALWTYKCPHGYWSCIGIWSAFPGTLNKPQNCSWLTRRY